MSQWQRVQSRIIRVLNILLGLYVTVYKHHSLFRQSRSRMSEFVDKDTRKTLELSVECCWKPTGGYCFFLWRQNPACQLDLHCHVVYFPSDLWHSLNCVLTLVRNEPTIWQSQCPSLNHNRLVLAFLIWVGLDWRRTREMSYWQERKKKIISNNSDVMTM